MNFNQIVKKLNEENIGSQHKAAQVDSKGNIVIDKNSIKKERQSLKDESDENFYKKIENKDNIWIMVNERPINKNPYNIFLVTNIKYNDETGDIKNISVDHFINSDGKYVKSDNYKYSYSKFEKNMITSLLKKTDIEFK